MSQAPKAPVPGDPRDWLDLYLDGMLSASDRAAFERLLEADPALRAQVALQARVDAALAARFKFDAPLAPTATPAPKATPTPAPHAPLLKLGWVRAAAAITVLAAGGAGAWWYSTRTERALASAYADDLARGLKPLEPCSSAEDFARYTREHLGAEVSFRLPEGLEPIGWDQTHRVFSDRTVAFFARYHGEPFVLFIDRASEDRDLPDRVDGCQVSKKLVGGVMIVEMRTRGTPCFLPRFSGR